VVDRWCRCSCVSFVESRKRRVQTNILPHARPARELRTVSRYIGRENTREKIMRSSLALLALVAAATLVSPAARADNGLEPPMDLLASQLRDQGFECKNPKKAKEEPKESAPHETVWLVDCDDASYRMTVVPDLAAKVQKLDKHHDHAGHDTHGN
jgi:hypothetical protein